MDKDIERALKLDELATDGPWESDSCGRIRYVFSNEIFAYANQGDGKLIAEYRTLCPKLATRLQAALERIEDLQNDLDYARKAPKW